MGVANQISITSNANKLKFDLSSLILKSAGDHRYKLALAIVS